MLQLQPHQNLIHGFGRCTCEGRERLQLSKLLGIKVLLFNKCFKVPQKAVEVGPELGYVVVFLERSDKVGPIFLPMFLAKRFDFLQCSSSFLDQVLGELARLLRCGLVGILHLLNCNSALLNHAPVRGENEVLHVFIHDGLSDITTEVSVGLGVAAPRGWGNTV
jgi:hypothetical protein